MAGASSKAVNDAWMQEDVPNVTVFQLNRTGNIGNIVPNTPEKQESSMEINKAIPVEEEWPDVVYEDESHEEYSRISEAVGELTSAILDCKLKEILTESLAKDLNMFLKVVSSVLKSQIKN